MARFADLIGSTTTQPEAPRLSRSDAGTSDLEARESSIDTHAVTTHAAVGAALSALSGSETVPATPAIPDPTSDLAAAFRTEIPASFRTPDEQSVPSTPGFDDDLLPIRSPKSKRR